MKIKVPPCHTRPKARIRKGKRNNCEQQLVIQINRQKLFFLLFRKQLSAATSWLAVEGSLLVGDLNRVPCVKWRRECTNYVLNADDKMLRGLLGANGCTCCQGDGSWAEGVAASLLERLRLLTNA